MKEVSPVFADVGDNQVDLIICDDGEAELSARVDARANSDEFLYLLSDLAAYLGCRLYSPELASFVGLTRESLVSALTRSSAWTYALDPAEAVKRFANRGDT